MAVGDDGNRPAFARRDRVIGGTIAIVPYIISTCFAVPRYYYSGYSVSSMPCGNGQTSEAKELLYIVE